MKEFTTLQIIYHLVGNIIPKGDASVDPGRLENLKEMCDLVTELVLMIEVVAEDKSHQHSIRIASEYAQTFLGDLRA